MDGKSKIFQDNPFHLDTKKVMGVVGGMPYTEATKILCVDDSRMVHGLVARGLHPYDVQLLFALDGEQGLNLLFSEHPDLVLIDFKMPCYDGIQFLERMRAAPEFRDTPALMITAELSTHNVISAVKLGVRDYLVKPFNEAVLVERISKQIRLQLRSSSTPFPITPTSVQAHDGQPVKGESPGLVTEAAESPSLPLRTAKDILIFEKTILHGYASPHEFEQRRQITCAEKIRDYLILFGDNNTVIGIFLKLLEHGKVKVELSDRTERLQLVDLKNIPSRAEAIALVDDCVAMLRSKDEDENLNQTQRITLKEIKSPKH
jgi:CheY-like chemotaxis protein